MKLKRENREINRLSETKDLAGIGWAGGNPKKSGTCEENVDCGWEVGLDRECGCKWLELVIAMGCVGNVDWRDGEVGFSGKCGITGVFWWEVLERAGGTESVVSRDSEVQRGFGEVRAGQNVDAQIRKSALHGCGKFGALLAFIIALAAEVVGWARAHGWRAGFLREEEKSGLAHSSGGVLFFTRLFTTTGCNGIRAEGRVLGKVEVGSVLKSAGSFPWIQSGVEPGTPYRRGRFLQVSPARRLNLDAQIGKSALHGGGRFWCPDLKSFKPGA